MCSRTDMIRISEYLTNLPIYELSKDFVDSHIR